MRHRKLAGARSTLLAVHALTTALTGVVLTAACSSNSSSASATDAGHARGGTSSSGGASSSGGTSSSASGGMSSSGGASSSSSGGNATSGGSGTAGSGAGGSAGSGGRVGGAGGKAATGGSGGKAGAPATGGAAGTPGDAGTPTTIDHLVTFYGWPDNDPPGDAIAYPKLHKGASGTGTYADPITFATDPKEWAPGTILYVPYLKRYVIMEDSCADCITDWSHGKYHIDLWLDSNGSFKSQVLACENTLTRSKTSIEVNPPATRPVDATPLFDTTAGVCHPP